MAKKKVKPDQVQFFDKFAKNVLTNTLLIRLESQGETITPEVQEQIIAVIGQSDVSLLSKAVSDKLLTLVDFDTLVEVEEFLNSPKAKQAMRAAQEVGELVQDEIFAVLGEIFAAPAPDAAQ